MTKNSLEESNKDKSAPSGCVNERLNYDHPKELIHEEISHHHVMQGPFQLQVYFEKWKQQNLSFIHQMQEPNFRERIELEIETEKKINVGLHKKKNAVETQVRQLEMEVEKIAETKKNEMMDNLLKQGMTDDDAQKMCNSFFRGNFHLH